MSTPATRTIHPEQPCSDQVILNGLRIAATPDRIKLISEAYQVVGDQGITYTVTVRGRDLACNCPARVTCKHIAGVVGYRHLHRP